MSAELSILMANAAPHEQAQLLLKQINPESWPICIDQLPEGTALVGGAVRDAFLGRHSQHTPILILWCPAMLYAHTARLAKAFGGKRVVLDEQRDIGRLVLKGWTIDLARQEGHCLEDDLWRRDYSLNAIAPSTTPIGPPMRPDGGHRRSQEGTITRCTRTEPHRRPTTPAAWPASTRGDPASARYRKQGSGSSDIAKR